MHNSFYQNLLNKLDYFVIETGHNGQIKMISSRLLKLLGYTAQEIRNNSLLKIISVDFFQDYFLKKKIFAAPFQNHRTHLRTQSGKKILVQISGFHEKDPQSGKISCRFLIQELKLGEGQHLDTGSFEDNVQKNQLIRRYISKQLVARVQSAVKKGYDFIPNEERVMTFLFADLVAYTAITEKSDVDEIVEMLNLSIGATSSAILHSGGFIDKIMGDSVFAVFEKPENSIVAAIEIQKQFNILNLFRLKQDQEEILVRVGVNTGSCLLASIGTAEFMELTFIGDAVNTASRLEKKATPGAILVSESTLASIRDKVETIKEVELTVKGKTEALRAYYVNRITVDGPKGPITLGLDDQMF